MRIGAAWELTALVLVLVATPTAEARGTVPVVGRTAAGPTAEPTTGTAAGSGPGVTGS
ncbi:hypothetical protein [Streptomyces sp. AP-93]|uniref:hypothetical protein n=1 Tax=Streptomyces sp. AP-93 TaxID=2929048 RepID=UPI001FAEDF61|nr:hypothetical protein [Streptomyces sp. AP-93]MCJ0873109.1 hypothetical protein [Streptomyces sp. AP-93]